KHGIFQRIQRPAGALAARAGGEMGVLGFGRGFHGVRSCGIFPSLSLLGGFSRLRIGNRLSGVVTALLFAASSACIRSIAASNEFFFGSSAILSLPHMNCDC